MKRITTRDEIKTVAERWKNSYKCEDQWYGPKDSEEKYKKLLALNVETAIPDDINDIIGNYAWTRLICNECEKEVQLSGNRRGDNS